MQRSRANGHSPGPNGDQRPGGAAGDSHQGRGHGHQRPGGTHTHHGASDASGYSDCGGNTCWSRQDNSLRDSHRSHNQCSVPEWVSHGLPLVRLADGVFGAGVAPYDQAPPRWGHWD